MIFNYASAFAQLYKIKGVDYHAVSIAVTKLKFIKYSKMFISKTSQEFLMNFFFDENFFH
jgi:hypothetical protein